GAGPRPPSWPAHASWPPPGYRTGQDPPARAVFLRIAHVLGLGGLDNSSSSEGATVHSLGRQPQDPETRQKKPFPAPAGRQARAVAEPSCRPDWGSERGRAGVAWGHPGAYASRL